MDSTGISREERRIIRRSIKDSARGSIPRLVLLCDFLGMQLRLGCPFVQERLTMHLFWSIFILLTSKLIYFLNARSFWQRCRSIIVDSHQFHIIVLPALYKRCANEKLRLFLSACGNFLSARGNQHGTRNPLLCLLFEVSTVQPSVFCVGTREKNKKYDHYFVSKQTTSDHVREVLPWVILRNVLRIIFPIMVSFILRKGHNDVGELYKCFTFHVDIPNNLCMMHIPTSHTTSSIQSQTYSQRESNTSQLLIYSNLSNYEQWPMNWTSTTACLGRHHLLSLRNCSPCPSKNLMRVKSSTGCHTD